MVLVDDQSLKNIQIKILDTINEYCKKYNLKFFLAYGTLLGAVRHKGFIPWDDDIDLFMPRKDYDFMIENFNKEKTEFKLLSLNDEGYLYPFAKVTSTDTILIEKYMKTNILGVNVDIFPLDNIPNDKLDIYKFKKQIMRLHFLQLISTRKLKRRSTIFKSFVALILYFPLSIIGYKRVLKFVDKKIKTFSNEKCFKLSNLSIDSYLFKEEFNAEWFSGITMLEFEGKEYPAPLNYDLVLKQIYGDYKTMPPINRRVKTHESEAYWKTN